MKQTTEEKPAVTIKVNSGSIIDFPIKDNRNDFIILNGKYINDNVLDAIEFIQWGDEGEVNNRGLNDAFALYGKIMYALTEIDKTGSVCDDSLQEAISSMNPLFWYIDRLKVSTEQLESISRYRENNLNNNVQQ